MDYSKKLFILFIFLFLIKFILAIKITEVELNPEGKDAGNEWIEFYSENSVNLSDYKIITNDRANLNLTGSFSGYYIFMFNKQVLDNEGEKVFLYRESELIDETVLFSDSLNNNKTWQLCDSWKFLESTKNEANICVEKIKSKDSFPLAVIKNTSSEKIVNVETKKIKNQTSLDKGEIIPENLADGEFTQNEKILVTSNVIKLNSKDIKSENDKKEKGKNNYGVYGLVIFCFLLAFLFVLKLRVSRKNEFE